MARGQRLAAEGLERRDAEVGEQLAAGALELEGALLDRRARDLPLGLRRVQRATAGSSTLPRSSSSRGRVAPISSRSRSKRAGPSHSAAANSPVVASSHATPRLVGPGLDRHHEGRLAGAERVGLELRGGRDDAHHLALDDALGGARVLHLLAERDPEALPHQPGDVAGGGVVGHAAHRDRLALLVLRARGEGDLERARGDHGVVEEQLVEVAHAEEHERVRVLGLHPVVLLHRRGLLECGRRHGGRWSIS